MVEHLDGANYLFVDGHVKWFKKAPLIRANLTGDCPPWLQRLGFTNAGYTGTPSVPGPWMDGMDYDANGIAGTSTSYD